MEPHPTSMWYHLPYGTCHSTQVNTPRLNPSLTGWYWYSIYLPRRDGRLSSSIGDQLYTEFTRPQTVSNPSILTQQCMAGSWTRKLLGSRVRRPDHYSHIITTSLALTQCRVVIGWQWHVLKLLQPIFVLHAPWLWSRPPNKTFMRARRKRNRSVSVAMRERLVNSELYVSNFNYHCNGAVVRNHSSTCLC